MAITHSPRSSNTRICGSIRQILTWSATQLLLMSAAARQTLPPSPILGLSPLSFSSETTTSQRCLLGSLGSLPKKTTLPAASGPAQSVVDRESLSACAPARPLVLLSPPSMHAPLYVRGVSLSLSQKTSREVQKKQRAVLAARPALPANMCRRGPSARERRRVLLVPVLGAWVQDFPLPLLGLSPLSSKISSG